MAKKKEPEAEQLTFEQSLAELEQIVAKLEGGKLGLGDSLAAYEQGVSRLNGCYRLLQHAERRIPTADDEGILGVRVELEQPGDGVSGEPPEAAAVSEARAVDPDPHALTEHGGGSGRRRTRSR